VTGDDGALARLRVLDLASLFAAPLIATVLGDLGADVVKVEPLAGDPMRRMGVARDGEPALWQWLGRNKRSIALDLDTEAGRADLHRLVAGADVVVENHLPPVLARWHATWPELSALNPGLVMVSVSCYGASGPYAGRVGAGTLAEAFGGLTHMTGEADGPPLLTSLPIGDCVTALTGVIGALAACYHRDAGGGAERASRAGYPGEQRAGPERPGAEGAQSGREGQHVDVAMFEPILFLLGSAIAGSAVDEPPPHRAGSRVPGGVPRNVYATADGRYVAVSGTTDPQVARLLPLLGREADADRFGRSRERLAHGDELDALVAEWIAARPADAVLDALLAARIPAAPVQDLVALLDDPHVAARASVLDVDGLRSVAPFPSLSATPGTVRRLAPALGEHTAEIRAELEGEA
jgi:crotonobetainyl-CoA:carnitine CoA-transferase CaiB-like acyl-CoA transferase